MNLEDIAKKAGVSRSTVSRVVNNDRYVSARTRELVMSIIEQENYQPHPAARALVTQRHQTIGVAIPQTANVFFGDNSYYPMLLQGIAETTIQRDYAMLLWLAQSHEERDDFSQRVIRNRQTDGLIITSVTEEDPLLGFLTEEKRLFVMVETPPRLADEINYVTVDNMNATAFAIAHLVETGRRRIATITGQLNIRDGADRLEGYRLGLERAGLPIDPQLIIPGVFNWQSGHDGLMRLLPFRPDAVVAGGDTIAAGVVAAVHEAGLRVPDDIAVIGFDDLDVATRVNPPLTTIRHSIQRIGGVAAQVLIDLIEGRVQSPQHVLMPTELVVRRSTNALVETEEVYPIIT